MAASQDPTHILRTAELRHGQRHTFDIRPDAPACALLAQALGLSALRKLRFAGQVDSYGADGWRLSGMLGATVVQPCGVTLDPVTTRIDEPVSRTYLARMPEHDGRDNPSDRDQGGDHDGGQDGAEMPEDDSVEPLGPVIDPHAVMIEALTLSLPPFPRAPGAELGSAQFGPPGVAPLDDAGSRPFAGLQALRDKLRDDGSDT